MHLTVYKTRGEKRCEQEQHCGMLVKDNNKIPSGQTRRYWELAEFHYSGALLSNTGLGVLACSSRALTSTDLASLDYASSTWKPQTSDTEALFYLFMNMWYYA